jgi:hypothetical protein
MEQEEQFKEQGVQVVPDKTDPGRHDRQDEGADGLH